MRQRKTDDETILQMFKEGKTQKKIAAYFGVSPVAIHKRIKRLCPPPETPHFNQLTDKEKVFVIEKAQGRSNIQAVMKSHDVTTRESAKSMSSQLMVKPEVQMAISELMDYHGLTRSYKIGKLKKHVDNVDPNVSLKALDMSFKLNNDFPPARNINLNADLPIHRLIDLSDFE